MLFGPLWKVSLVSLVNAVEESEGVAMIERELGRMVGPCEGE